MNTDLFTVFDLCRKFNLKVQDIIELCGNSEEDKKYVESVENIEGAFDKMLRDIVEIKNNRAAILRTKQGFDIITDTIEYLKEEMKSETSDLSLTITFALRDLEAYFTAFLRKITEFIC